MSLTTIETLEGFLVYSKSRLESKKSRWCKSVSLFKKNV